MLHYQRIVGAAVALMTTSALAWPQDFSFDALSPEYPARSCADIIDTGGILTVYTAAQLGLAAVDEMDAFSYGKDELVPMGQNSWRIAIYSVDRTTVGVGGSVIQAHSTFPGNGAAGDEYSKVWNASGIAGGIPALWRDAPAHLLTPLPGQSDEDALDWFRKEVYGPPASVYLSLDPVAAAGWSHPAEILLQAAPGAGAVLPVPYATIAATGLLPGDDIDALAVMDVGAVGTFDAGDIVYVSLTPGSATLGAIGATAASIIQLAPGAAPVEIVSEDKLGLLPLTDNLNALSVYDPSADSQWYCGSGINIATDGYVILSPAVLGGVFVATVTGCAPGSAGAILVGYASSLSFPTVFGEVLVNIADPSGELLGMPIGYGDPAAIMLPVPNDLRLAGFVFYTQAVSIGLSLCLHCAYECMVGF